MLKAPEEAAGLTQINVVLNCLKNCSGGFPPPSE